MYECEITKTDKLTGPELILRRAEHAENEADNVPLFSKFHLFAKIYQNKICWILSEGCKSDEILELLRVFHLSQSCYSYLRYSSSVNVLLVVYRFHTTQ